MDAAPSGPLVKRRAGSPGAESIQVWSRGSQGHQGCDLGRQPYRFPEQAVKERGEAKRIPTRAQRPAIPLECGETSPGAVKVRQRCRWAAVDKRGRTNPRFHDRAIDRIDEGDALEAAAVVANSGPTMRAQMLDDPVEHPGVPTHTSDEATSHRVLPGLGSGRLSPEPPGQGEAKRAFCSLEEGEHARYRARAQIQRAHCRPQHEPRYDPCPKRQPWCPAQGRPTALPPDPGDRAQDPDLLEPRVGNQRRVASREDMTCGRPGSAPMHDAVHDHLAADQERDDLPDLIPGSVDQFDSDSRSWGKGRAHAHPVDGRLDQAVGRSEGNKALSQDRPAASHPRAPGHVQWPSCPCWCSYRACRLVGQRPMDCRGTQGRLSSLETISARRSSGT